MNSRTKKRLTLLAVLVILLASIAATVWAYFTTEARARNVITTSKVDITLNSSADSSQAIPVMPGVTVEQEIDVANAPGAADSYVRVKAEIGLTKAGDSAPITAEEQDRILSVSSDSADWVDGKDGWWYYRNVLSASPENATDEQLSKTTPLLLKLAFSGPNMGNEYQNATGEIAIVAQAIQAKNNAPENGDVTNAFKNDSGEPIEIYAHGDWAGKDADGN